MPHPDQSAAPNSATSSNTNAPGPNGATPPLAPSKWDEWFRKLDACAQLKDGWNGNSATPPNISAIDNAKRFLNKMKEVALSPTRVAASAIGGVAITRRQGVRKGFVEFYNDGKIYRMLADRDSDEMDVVELANDENSFAVFIDQMREYLDGST